MSYRTEAPIAASRRIRALINKKDFAMITFGNHASAKLIGVAALLSLTGCLSQRQSFQPTASNSPAPAQAATTTMDHDGYAAEPSYARTNGHHQRYDFAQVSLFGDLPGVSSGESTQHAGPSLQQHTFAVEGACFDPVVSPDGKNMVFASTQHNLQPDIYLKPIGYNTMTQLTSDPAGDVQPTFSPDGQKVAFCSDRSGNWDIYATELATGKTQQLTDDPAPEMHPSYSADGRELAYCRYNMRSGQWEIWVMDLQAGQKRFVTPGLFPQFSPVDHRIVYQRAKQRGSRWFSIWEVEINGSGTTMPTEIAASPERALTTPRWSADGQFIVYCAVAPTEGQSDNAIQNAQVWVIRRDGTAKMPVTDPGTGSFSPVCCRDGRIFFCANRGGSENIWSVLPMITQDDSSVEANRPVALDGAQQTTGHNGHDEHLTGG